MFWLMALWCTTLCILIVLFGLGWLVFGTSDLDNMVDKLDEELVDNFDFIEYDGEQGNAKFLVFNIAFIPTMVLVFLLRRKFRIVRNIEGSECNDCCLSVCCTPGAVAQMYWEINNTTLWRKRDWLDV